MTIGLYLVYGTHLSPLWCWLPIGWMGANTESWYGGQKGVWLGESFLLGLGDLNRWHEGIRGFDFPRWVGRKEFMEGLQEDLCGEAWQSLAGLSLSARAAAIVAMKGGSLTAFGGQLP